MTGRAASPPVSTRPIRVSLATPYDPGDVSHWSGTTSFMAAALDRQAGLSLARAGPVDQILPASVRFKGAIVGRLLGRGFWPGWEAAAIRRTAGQLSGRLGPADVVLGLAANHLHGLRTDRPIVMWTDSPLAGLIDSYDYASGLHGGTARNVRRVERAVFDRAAALVFTSAWAAGVARREYGVPEAKLHVIPFGANLADPPSAGQVQFALTGRLGTPTRVLFVGVDWERKGGPIAVEAVRRLNDGGVPARLVVLGCEPPAGVAALPFVEPVGFVSKATRAGRRTVAERFAAADFLLVPTRAEAYGMVFAEASAFGVPSVTTDVGGVGGVVTDGVNGVRLPADAPPAAYADWIAGLVAAPARYADLCRSARRAFDERLNWAAATAAVADVFRSVVP